MDKQQAIDALWGKAKQEWQANGYSIGPLEIGESEVRADLLESDWNYDDEVIYLKVRTLVVPYEKGKE